jgi:hypothetical protein
VALNTITINIFSRDKANHVGMGNNNYGRSEPASKTATVTLLPLPDYRLCLYVWRLNVSCSLILVICLAEKQKIPIFKAFGFT